MQQFSFEAIGTKWWIEIFDDISHETLTVVQDHCERFCDKFNQRYSRFLPDSLITRLNQDRVLEEPDDACRALLAYGKELYLRSHGAFNFLNGHILEARGYDAQYSFQTHDDLATLRAANPITDLTITSSSILVHHGKVDIGGYGKGWLIDELATILRNHSLQYFLINGGGDMFATSDHEKPITIYLEHPLNENEYLIPTTLRNQGFAASSPFKRQWRSQERTYTHIVSDAGMPSVATFVKADTATDADAFATACLLLDAQTTLRLCADEHIACARFTPDTNELWQSADFSS